MVQPSTVTIESSPTDIPELNMQNIYDEEGRLLFTVKTLRQGNKFDFWAAVGNDYFFKYSEECLDDVDVLVDQDRLKNLYALAGYHFGRGNRTYVSV